MWRYRHVTVVSTPPFSKYGCIVIIRKNQKWNATGILKHGQDDPTKSTNNAENGTEKIGKEMIKNTTHEKMKTEWITVKYILNNWTIVVIFFRTPGMKLSL